MQTQTSQPYLEVRVAGASLRQPLNDQPLTIGRHASNTLVLSDDLASRFHCVIEKTADGIQLRDLGSRNGTRLNGEIVKTTILSPDDIVKIGRTELRLVMPGAGSASADTESAEDWAAPLDLSALSEIEPEAPEEAEQIDTADFEQVLVRKAASLPDKDFTEADITLINARGKVTHASAGKPIPDGGREAVGILRLILLVCFRIRATDIHIEPKESDYQVRIRVDGNMVELVRITPEVGTRLTSVVKILCDIDLGQRNIIQEGHFSARVPGRRVDYRVSFAPAMFGQKLVIRVLDTAAAPLYVWDLSLPDWMQSEVERAIQQESGMVLVCGPTGSGKTTTLYAAVRSIDSGERNVVTIEDPVEIQIEGVTQIPVNEQQGNSFSNLLRSVLRQDPDAILVGEIRDVETARIAMQAAMTGHLVFSTIHAKDTLSTIFRLLDLGVEPFLVASGLQQVLAQRLVRLLCPYCKVPARPTPQQRQKMGKPAEGVEQIYAPGKCHRCLHTGFAGRRAIFELLNVNESLREVILRNPNMQDIQQALADERFIKLSQAGFELVAAGVTSFDEIDRAAG